MTAEEARALVPTEQPSNEVFFRIERSAIKGRFATAIEPELLTDLNIAWLRVNGYIVTKDNLRHHTPKDECNVRWLIQWYAK